MDKYIKITQCRAFGPHFANIKPGSIHKVLPEQRLTAQERAGVWVQGQGVPVRILSGEFEFTEAP